MLPQWVIEKKRDGLSLTAEELDFFVKGSVSGLIPDYQIAAFLMAVYLNGMSFEETAELTERMLHSGDLIDTSKITLPKVDKHSTGGIGDKISLLLAPLVACFDVAVPMISGRGLGITGGTLDKLEAIPGYRCNLSEVEFLKVLQSCGCSITGQTGTLVPADRKFYALRDVTGTVPSIPLIVSSIMSKKLAEGIDALVLDVKFGRGAFMRDKARARELAEAMVRVGELSGKKVSALLTDMDEPLGESAGNALEVAETVQILQGKNVPDVIELTLRLGAEMLILAGRFSNEADAVKELAGCLGDGRAFERFARMVALQGGDPETLESLHEIQRAPFIKTIDAACDGFISSVDPEAVGRACVSLGAGRMRAEDNVDFRVGISSIRKRGSTITRGEPLMQVHSRDEKDFEQVKGALIAAVEISESPPLPRTLIAEILR